MKLLKRFLIMMSLVLVGLIVQGVLFAHLSAARDIPPGSLNGPLAEIPMRLGSWMGQDLPIEEKLKYADEHFQRGFINVENGQQLTLWMVFSQTGVDREHHPEICFQVAGQQEDANARTYVEVGERDAPVQQMRFGVENQHQLVYYWHYTLPRPEVEGLPSLQLEYQKLRRRSASVTMQVFAPEMSEHTAERAIEFVKLADAAMQPLVGPDAARGSNRLPVTFVAE